MIENARQRIAYLSLMSGFGGVIGFLTGLAVPTFIPITTISGATLLGTVAVVSAPN